MAKKSAVIHMSNGTEIKVPMDIDEIGRLLAEPLPDGAAPILRITDTEDKVRMINRDEIVEIEGK
jgi:hypothetical protein